jgi:glutamate dehydrogenase
MAGDVFGNGLLRSPATQLVGAFNHLHIFIDPEPDLAKSFAERQRLFDLPRSSWRDYDAKLISKGGGIFDRSAKAIPLSAEMKTLFDLQGEAASGEEVIRRMLTAKVDLLYNGGIGTYVKASGEEDADVGDRANDRVRVDGKDVRAKVIGEGGNLGLTQKGRLEYWATGGSLNTDAVDNSGGVGTSDHEVNIKILMSLLIKKGIVKGKAERNRILQEMTDEVGELVLLDNENQARALTLDGMRSATRYEEFVAYIADLVGAGVLNRLDDAIPAGDELLALPTKARGLPRPLLAVLLGHVKNSTFSMVMETGFPESPAGRPFLDAYFPKRLRESYAEYFEGHALRREIVATAAVNHIINHAGVVFVWRVMTESKAGIGEVVAAYIDVEREAEARELREALFAAGRKASEEHEALLEIEDALEISVLAVLEGKKKIDATAKLKTIRAKLKV